MNDCCPCPKTCSRSETEAYAIDAAGQKVVVGDYVMASLPNVPATRRPRTLHPCRVVQLQKACFHLLYAGGDRQLLKWKKETFLRWSNEVVKADISGLGLTVDDAIEDCSCNCPLKRMACDGE